MKAAAARLAKDGGVSLNRWFGSAVARKVGAVGTAAGFLRCRAGDARPEDPRAVPARAQDRASDSGDGLRDGRR